MSLSLTSQATWQSILDMTERMRALSDQQEWEKVASLACERQAKLESFFNSSDISAGEEASRVAQGIQQIIKIDQLLMVAGTKLKAEIGDSLHSMTSNRKAIQQYEGFKR